LARRLLLRVLVLERIFCSDWKPNRGRFLDSIFYQSWTFDIRTIWKPDKKVWFSNGH
jgi:hypothetical protein